VCTGPDVRQAVHSANPISATVDGFSQTQAPIFSRMMLWPKRRGVYREY
jgi:hypothetical protein